MQTQTIHARPLRSLAQGRKTATVGRSSVVTRVSPPLTRPGTNSNPLVTAAENSKLPLPDGSTGLPFLGETLEYQKQGVLRFALERYKKYGPVFKTSIFGQELYMVCSMPLYQAVMAEDTRLHNFMVAGTFGKLQGEFTSGVMSNKNNSRMPWRRSMLGSVTSDALAGYMPTVERISQAEVAQLAGTSSWDVNDVCRRLGMAFASTLLAGIDLENEEQAAALRTDVGIFFDGLFTFDLDLPGTPLRKAYEAKERLEARLKVVVEQQLGEILKEKEVITQSGPKLRKNFVAYVIDARRAAGETVDTDFLVTMTLGALQAGTDTTAASMSGLMAMVGQLPEVQARIREELSAVAAAQGPALTKQYLDSCKYLDAVVREALRLYPPTTLQWRTTEVEMEVGGKRIPKGSTLVMNVTTAHALELQPNWLEQQEAGPVSRVPTAMDVGNLRAAFKAERWMDPETKPTLLTFGHGPHICLGMALYIMEAKAVLATMLRNHNLELLTTEFQWQEMPMARPTGKVSMRLNKL